MRPHYAPFTIRRTGRLLLSAARAALGSVEAARAALGSVEAALYYGSRWRTIPMPMVRGGALCTTPMVRGGALCTTPMVRGGALCTYGSRWRTVPCGALCTFYYLLKDRQTKTKAKATSLTNMSEYYTRVVKKLLFEIIYFSSKVRKKFSVFNFLVSLSLCTKDIKSRIKTGIVKIFKVPIMPRYPVMPQVPLRAKSHL